MISTARLLFRNLAFILLMMPAMAAANDDLAMAKDCFACHSIQHRLVGPAYKDVAARYSGQSGAETMLVQKVLKGSSGTWGNIRMPANNRVSEEEARILVKWVLSQNK